jgi:putative endopeptidase
MYRHWAYVITLLQSTSFLSEHLREVGSMFRNALMGIDKAMPLEKFAYNVTAEIYSEPVGLYYGKKYFGYEARKDIESIANDIIKQYIVRINNSDILSEETKKKAVLKLEKINVKMGFPDNVDKVYDSYVFDDSTSLLDVVVKTRRLFTEHEFSKLYEKVDKKKWHMGGHIVNAMYNPTDNDITFPAAILQPPFYSIKQSRSANLGGIGAVIGHEISHAFDNNGAKCDENGCLNNWWTKEDFKKFKARTKDMIKEFEGIELPWGKVNSSFIVSENIADNGGMAVTLDLMKKLKNASYEDYFITWAKVWCMKAKPEYLQLLLTVDVHAPNILRANMPPRNFPEWYDTFKVSNKDKMYISPKKRVVIW